MRFLEKSCNFLFVKRLVSTILGLNLICVSGLLYLILLPKKVHFCLVVSNPSYDPVSLVYLGYILELEFKSKSFVRFWIMFIFQ